MNSEEVKYHLTGEATLGYYEGVKANVINCIIKQVVYLDDEAYVVVIDSLTQTKLTIKLEDVFYLKDN